MNDAVMSQALVRQLSSPVCVCARVCHFMCDMYTRAVELSVHEKSLGVPYGVAGSGETAL